MKKARPGHMQAKQKTGKSGQARTAVRGFFSVFGRLALSVFLVCVITGCIVVTVLTVYVMKFVDMDELVDIRNVDLNYITTIYAQDAETGESVPISQQYTQKRTWIDYEDIPQDFKDATVAVEDERFFQHEGVDWKRTVFAAVNEVVGLRDTFGGSTLTQQLVKNITNDDKINIQRKVREIFRAINVEKNYTKVQILEAYLNVVGFGGNTYGVNAAARYYFDKDVSELNLAECACIVGITKSPVYYNPYVYPEANKKRQLDVLYMMYSLGYITKSEYEQACDEELVFKKGITDSTDEEYQSYYVDEVYRDVVSDLQTELGYTEEKSVDMFLNGGLQIYTTVDMRIQNILEEIYADDSNFMEFSMTDPDTGETVHPESACIIMNLQGEIVGMVGGRGEKQGNLVLNRATQSLRQPGSAMKPIATYGPSIELNLINWSTLIPDQPIDYKGDKWPVNYYGYYGGNVTVMYALQQSINTVPARIMTEKLSMERSYDFLVNKLGITSLDPINDVASPAPLTLGGLTNGITPEELTAAYAPFANGGMYYKPHTYTKVLDSDGNVLLENNPLPIRAFSEDTAAVMNKLLQNVVANGTGKLSNFGSQWQQGGKTGTTSDQKDFWWVGITPYYAASVWYGYDKPAYINVVNDQPSERVYKKIMTRVYETLEQKTFPESANIVQKAYCTETGLLATANCPSTALGWYKKSSLPQECDVHTGQSASSEEVSSEEPGSSEESSPSDSSESVSSDEESSSSKRSSSKNTSSKKSSDSSEEDSSENTADE